MLWPGVLPRQRVGGVWLSQAIGLNDRVSKMCRESGVGFMDVRNCMPGMVYTSVGEECGSLVSVWKG